MRSSFGHRLLHEIGRAGVNPHMVHSVRERTKVHIHGDRSAVGLYCNEVVVNVIDLYPDLARPGNLHFGVGHDDDDLLVHRSRHCFGTAWSDVDRETQNKHRKEERVHGDLVLCRPHGGKRFNEIVHKTTSGRRTFVTGLRGISLEAC